MEDNTFAMLVVSRALVDSYPTWTDEHGTNVEQLTAIAISALAAHGLLIEPEIVVEHDDRVDAEQMTIPSVSP